MFVGATSFNQDIGVGILHKCTRYGSMFSRAHHLIKILEVGILQSVTNMSGMFSRAHHLIKI